MQSSFTSHPTPTSPRPTSHGCQTQAAAPVKNSLPLQAWASSAPILYSSSPSTSLPIRKTASAQRVARPRALSPMLKFPTLHPSCTQVAQTRPAPAQTDQSRDHARLKQVVYTHKSCCWRARQWVHGKDLVLEAQCENGRAALKIRFHVQFVLARRGLGNNAL